MSVLILTRAREDSTALQSECETLGMKCVLCPMLHIRPVPAQVEGDFDFVVASSRHVFGGQLTVPQTLLSTPFYVVGEKTAKAAQQAGFEKPCYVAATMQALLTHLKSQKLAANTAALYLRGEHISESPAAHLTQLKWREVICYCAEAAEAFSPQAASALGSDAPVAAVFYSARSAAIFESLLPKPMPVRAQMTAFCISRKVANALSAGLWNKIEVAALPNHDAMLALLRAKLL